MRPAIPCAVAVALLLATLVVSGPLGADVATSPVQRVWSEPASGYGFLDGAINAAHSSIDLSMYELADATIERDLIDRARAGVNVRVILNADYYGTSENGAAFAALRAGSVHVIWAPSGQIFHAKYMVIDNKVAYVGTGNLVPSDYPSTRDFWVLDASSRDVAAIAATFDGDFAHGGTLSRQAGGLVWSPGSTEKLVGLISSAQRTLLVENEEMDSTPIEDALIASARRHVSVEVVMTKDAEWAAALQRLASAGVHVRVLGASQLYIHAKVICADCTSSAGTVFLGSENFSTSSLVYNRELGLITSTNAAVQAVRIAVTADYAAGAPLAGTTTPTTTPTVPSSGHGVTITSLIASINPGGYELLLVHSSRSNDSCSLSVVLPSGYASASQGLGEARANAAGNVTWRWKIGTNTDPGTARATVRCAAGSVTKAFTIT